jgi:aspartate kinase
VPRHETGHATTRARVAVVKIGGSILRGPISYASAARFIKRRITAAPQERLVVVVSAQDGVTDALEREARAIVHEPNAAALDLLWSTGELRSVALLALHLQLLGIAAAALGVQETGIWISDERKGAASAEFELGYLRNALAGHRVVIVPGFLGVKRSGRIVSLGRGGSDLTAVLLAARLGASRCELIKDVPGYFSADPHRDARASHLPRLSFAEALAMAEDGCDLVQRQALEAAAECGLPLVVRSLREDAPESWVTPEPGGKTLCAETVGGEPMSAEETVT